jgi:hypothetical protein
MANKIVTQRYTENATTLNKEMPSVTKLQQGKYIYTKNTHTKRDITHKHQKTTRTVMDDSTYTRNGYTTKQYPTNAW